jgi:ATP-dependent RNA helicase RhlE
MMNTEPFVKLRLIEPLLHALADEGYEEPTKVQRAAIPELLAGKDLLATAQTGTGKTAAFALPILQMLHQRPREMRRPTGTAQSPDTPKSPSRRRRGSRRRRQPAPSTGIRALVLTPTRELAMQIDESFRAYGRYLELKTTVVVGGVSSKSQIHALHLDPEILVATPGRLIDLHNQRVVRLDRVEMLVLDEADRMLDMGFVHDVRKIVSKTPAARQTMFFSATLTGEVGRLAADMLRDPVRVEVTPAASVSDDIDQKVLFVQQINKRELLKEILKNNEIERALVFTRTKVGAEFIMKLLKNYGVSTDAIHSDRFQKERQRALSAFDQGKIRVLVATDIVARGIDVEGISHVINYELPNDPESYVHRIGRTARAGAAGTALSFCDAGEVAMLEGIEKLTGHPLTTIEDHPYHSAFVAGLLNRNAASRVTSPGQRLRRRSRMRSRGSRRHV